MYLTDINLWYNSYDVAWIISLDHKIAQMRMTLYLFYIKKVETLILVDNKAVIKFATDYESAFATNGILTQEQSLIDWVKIIYI